MEGSKIQANKLLAQSNGEFWYRRRGTQSKGRRGNLYRGMGPPHVNQTPHHPGSPPATGQPAQSALSLSPRRYSHRRRWTAPAAGTPSTGTRSRYAHPPLPRALPSPPLAPPLPPTRLPLHARPCFALRLLYQVGGWGSEFDAARASAGAAPTPRLRDLVSVSCSRA
jgi:hypothetical protein